MMASSTWEAEAEGIPRKVKASLGYTVPDKSENLSPNGEEAGGREHERGETG